MKLTTDWSIIPIHTINVSDLSSPYDISLYMKGKKITKYLYQITYKGTVLKYGMSADNSRNYGERLYRQIGHIKSWGTLRLTGSSGSDFRIIEEDFQNLNGTEIDKNFVEIRVWDVSNYPFTTINPWNEVLAMESQLITKYVDAVGKKPIGNINDEANAFRRPAIQKTTWTSLFDAVTA